MRKCSIPAPEQISAGTTRPLLLVKQYGRVQGYAAFRDGIYEFNVADETAELITAGEIIPTFEYYEDTPIAIVLEERDRDKRVLV